MTPAEAAQAVADLIAGHRWRYTSEAELQAGITAMLGEAAWSVWREVRLGEGSRIDLVACRWPARRDVERVQGMTLRAFRPGDRPLVGIECKVAGSPAAVQRQVDRYLEAPQIDALVLVSNRVRHVPKAVLRAAKPVRFACIARAV